MASIIDGNSIAKNIRERLHTEIADVQQTNPDSSPLWSSSRSAIDPTRPPTCE